mmetsp:Transcript_10519/g.14584  ORF Transcript_10519/g.14584 Transcript_10519/m.14584 type:complete len:107 (+) Transcript_10519:166-486(+)
MYFQEGGGAAVVAAEALPPPAEVESLAPAAEVAAAGVGGGRGRCDRDLADLPIGGKGRPGVAVMTAESMRGLLLAETRSVAIEKAIAAGCLRSKARAGGAAISNEM